jgi:hypothetical protein
MSERLGPRQAGLASEISARPGWLKTRLTGRPTRDRVKVSSWVAPTSPSSLYAVKPGVTKA